MTVIGKTGDRMNVWLKKDIYKILVLDALMVELLGRKTICQKLREENKNIESGKRYPKYWGQAKVTAFIFNVVGTIEVERLVKDSIKWVEKIRRVSVLRKGESGRQKPATIKKILVRTKKKEEE